MRALSPISHWRAYAFGLVTTLIFVGLVLAERVAEKYISDRSRLAGAAVEITIVVLAALVFRPLHRRVDQMIEAAFTKRRREAREALSHLRKELTSIPSEEHVLRRVVEAVDRHMSTAGCAIYLRRSSYTAEASSFDVPLPNVEPNDALVIRLRSAAAPTDPRALQSAAQGELAFPMMAGGALIGFLTVTPKRIEYDDDDRHALGALADAAGAALLALDSRLRVRDEPRTNLPQMLTSFVGRENDVAEITGLLHDHRLITLTGSAGVGKTRTSLRVATNLFNDFGDGVWLVELGPISDASLVVAAVAKALSLRESPNRPMLDALVRHLKRRQLLLILDNCEHLINQVRIVASAILHGCPEVSILATSRQGLNIAGEEEYRMPSLETPPVDERSTAQTTAAYGAVRLFTDRALSANKHFALADENAADVAEICRRLDGIPLAIELAAARVKVLSPKQLRERLDERFRVLTGGDRSALAHHQTMRTLIDWSYDLLDEHERTLFRRLGIFVNGFVLEGAVAVGSGDDIDERDVLDLLTSLVDKSLVQVEFKHAEPRYRLLESMREYAREKLIGHGELEATARAHAQVCIELAERLESEWHATPEALWRESAEPELENFRAALAWAFGVNGDLLLGQRLAAALRPAWFLAPSEGRRWVATGLQRVEADTPARVAARLELAAASLHMFGLKNEAARQSAARALDLFLPLGDVESIAMARLFFGGALGLLGEAEEGERHLLMALTAFRERGNRREIGAALGYLALSRARAGDLERSRPLLAEALEAYRGIGALRPAAHIALVMAEIEYQSGNAHPAIRLAREALANDRELRDLDSVVFDLCNLAAYLVSVEHWEQSTASAREGLILAREREIEVGAALAIQHLAAAAALRPVKENESECDLRARAARLIGYVDLRFEGLGYPRDFTDQHEYDAVLHALDEDLRKQSLDVCLAEGRAWSEERAVKESALT